MNEELVTNEKIEIRINPVAVSITSDAHNYANINWKSRKGRHLIAHTINTLVNLGDTVVYKFSDSERTFLSGLDFLAFLAETQDAVFEELA